jgi:hypothetical protein
MGFNDSYCEDAVAKSQDRMLSSLNQKSQMFGDGKSRFVEKLRDELASAWIQINSDVQERYGNYLVDLIAHNLEFVEQEKPLKFMKFRSTIINEYAEVTAKVNRVEAALDYAEYTLS